ncbi:SDR family oxidoreductase [Stackebrandtia nassauensis]|uniref:Short-chain dehydrogenase/reductase SDR n=1 Tax=Stackebrandtia nassauensis (strain DSM 44728 / CIP 108903 / NRRL B-16338 / NBRC 102104 / LLR-40K-21) TaxID=446470 RepID=D3Q8H6_STANL|nr:SDR family NAD(P)-dependent oxidoreductase [Stackebrandtia nassauensis]ADD42550.1 short-chain dehydrogenase/reductase SDR [Stackebrandtia nassauensis DSM 44728]
MSPTRTAIVTGGAHGIGAGIARRFAADGLAVAIVDINAERAAATAESITADGGTAIALPTDIGDAQATTDAVNTAAERLGGVGVLVNNAGYARDADLPDMTTAQWDEVINIHLNAAFHTVKAAHPYMREAGWGRIINISSISALGTPGRVNYSAAKAGLLGYTKSLALELAPEGITANAIAPGFIVSDMTAATAKRLGRDFDEHQRIAADSIPVGRVGRPEDIAHAAAFFAAEAAGFITGQVVYVSGGVHG